MKICALFIEYHLKMSAFNFIDTAATLDFLCGNRGWGSKAEISVTPWYMLHEFFCFSFSNSFPQE